MQRVPATIEEQLILKAIKEECPWESLPKRLQATLSSKEEWHRRIVEHCIKKRLQWNTCFARKICKETEYYEDLMRYLRKNLAVRLISGSVLSSIAATLHQQSTRSVLYSICF
uniref:FAM91 N-terminal domain-containing protein n=1 Tax=Cannabis sativa TaxID=3483 RepID=A0A803RCA1_CANSA